MKEVSKSANGVHMSAGPLEGMVELGRFFGLSSEHTAFGHALVKAGFTHEQINHLAQNPTGEHNGKRVSAFDLTEEKDTPEAVQLLKSFQISN